MNSPLQVQCHCGAVSLELTAKPIAQFYCHCDDCQVVHGAAYAPRSLYPFGSVTVKRGEPHVWKLRTIPRYLCRDCGNHLFADVAEYRVRSINAYLLPAGQFKPQFHLRCRFAVLPVKDVLPHYKDLPAIFGGSDEVVDW